MIPLEIFTSFVEFQLSVGVHHFRTNVRLEELLLLVVFFVKVLFCIGNF